jgi:hypothetical protein
MAHGDARDRKWRGNWPMEWVASTLHTTWERGVSSITTADAHTSAVSSRLNWRPRRFKWTRPFRLKTKSGFCACAITFQTQSTTTELLRGGDHCSCSVPSTSSTYSDGSVLRTPQLISLQCHAVHNSVLFKRIFHFLSAMFLNTYSALLHPDEHTYWTNVRRPLIPSSSQLTE